MKRWYHLKRGTTYVELGRAIWIDTRIPGMDDMELALRERSPGVWTAENAVVIDGYLFGKLQASGRVRIGTELVVYRADIDGSLWARPTDEFMDGRFAADGVSTTSPDLIGDGAQRCLDKAAALESAMADDDEKFSAFLRDDMLAAIDALRQAAAAMGDASSSPAAWVFELAKSRLYEEGREMPPTGWGDWGKPELSFTRPNVPEGSIRNLKALFATTLGGFAAGDPLALAECPIGLFVSPTGELCLKTEYQGDDGRIHAYIVESGEAFSGGSGGVVARQRAVMVSPVEIAVMPSPDRAF